MDPRVESVVRIYSKTSFSGTGFLVHRSNDAGFIMTCHHVVNDFLKIPGAMRIIFPDGDPIDVSIVKEDESTDLALLRYADINTRGSPRALQISPPGAPYVGPVELIAYFVSSGATIRPGISTGLTIGEPITSSKGFHCNISNQVNNPGTSGGPLMAKNKVIGVNVAVQGIKYSIAANDIYATLRKWSKATKKDIEIRDMLTMIAAETATSSSVPTATAPTAMASSSNQ